MRRNNRVDGVEFFRYAMLFYFAALIVIALLSGRAHAEVAVSITGAEVVAGDTGERGLAAYVRLPFDEEYGIVLDNKDQDRRALVNIRIDGRAVTGDGLILRTGERITLERFIDSGSLTRGKRFKFVPKMDEPLRRANEEDGLIAVVVQYEKSKKPLVMYENQYAIFTAIPGWHNLHISGTSFVSNNTSIPVSDSGITVEGSVSTQRFQEDKIGELDDGKDTLVISLRGYYKTQPILIRR